MVGCERHFCGCYFDYITNFVGGMIMVSALYDQALTGFEKTVAAVSTAWIPRKPWIGFVGVCACWYGRRVALTYAPGYVANYFIQATIVFTGSATIGKATGIALVAPMFTPSVVPWVATITGLALLYSVVLICNLFQQYVIEKIGQNTKIADSKKSEI